jgi:7-cyano-7-deazaguanine synthase in queuosine biosynthesis
MTEAWTREPPLLAVPGRKVVLYSGGLDSYCLAYLEKPDICLYANVDSSYSDKELGCLLPPPGDALLVVDSRLRLYDVERSDLIVPNRNTLLVMIAAMYGTRIFLGATAGDRSRDKDEEWARACEALLNHVYHYGQHWLPEGRVFAVELPGKMLSKAAIVREYLAAGGGVAQLLETVSCYDRLHRACGRCKACFRRWVALMANEVDSTGQYAQDPRLYMTREIAESVRRRAWRCPEEDADTERVMLLTGGWPAHV